MRPRGSGPASRRFSTSVRICASESLPSRLKLILVKEQFYKQPKRENLFWPLGANRFQFRNQNFLYQILI
jgi:hypothetical protein